MNPKPPSLNHPSCLVVNTSYLPHCSHCFVSTLCVSYHTSQPFPFYPEAWIRRYSRYHTHTPFIDMTSITARGRLASAQTANGVHLVLMKYLQSYTEAFSCVSRGGLCPVSTLLFMDKRNGSQDNSIDLAPSPTSPHPLHHPPNTLSVQTDTTYMREGVSLC